MDDQFKIKEVRVYQPLICPIPEGWPQRKGPSQYLIYAEGKAIERIMQHAGEDLRRECFGILLGNAYFDDRQKLLWIHLQESVPAHNTRSAESFVEVSTDEFRRINEEVDVWRERTQGKIRKVGWYHSHPNFGIFMSHTDRTNQRRYYHQEWQIALVVDPVRGTMGFFRGPAANRCPHRIVDIPGSVGPDPAKMRHAGTARPTSRPTDRRTHQHQKGFFQSLWEAILELFGSNSRR